MHLITEYFFCIIQTIQLWHYWEIACSISINNIFFHCYKKHLKWEDCLWPILCSNCFKNHDFKKDLLGHSAMPQLRPFLYSQYYKTFSLFAFALGHKKRLRRIIRIAFSRGRFALIQMMIWVARMMALTEGCFPVKVQLIAKVALHQSFRFTAFGPITTFWEKSTIRITAYLLDNQYWEKSTF